MACAGLAFHSVPAAVTHGAPFDRSRSPRVLAPNLTLQHPQQQQHWRVLALNEEDAEITSIQGHLHPDDRNLFESVFCWGRRFQRQAQKFFHELADGSFLMSFGAPETKPQRLPSRFTKKLPYSRSIAEGSTLKKLPTRNRSDSKKSPIQQASYKHATLTGSGNGLAGAFTFQDVLIEAVVKAPKDSRPKTTFCRKSPIPQASTPRKRKKLQVGQVSEVVQENIVQVSLESIQVSRHTRPRSAFIRKSPIQHPAKARRKRPVQEQEQEQQSCVSELRTLGVKHITQDEAALEEPLKEQKKAPDNHLHALGETTGKPIRPRASFVRKSPITIVKGGRRKQVKKSEESPSAQVGVKDVTKATEEQSIEDTSQRAVQNLAISITSADTGTALKRPSRRTSFVRRSPVTAVKGGRRRKVQAQKQLPATDVAIDIKDITQWEDATEGIEKVASSLLQQEQQVQEVAAETIETAESATKAKRPFRLKASFVRKSPVTRDRKNVEEVPVAEASSSEVILEEEAAEVEGAPPQKKSRRRRRIGGAAQRQAVEATMTDLECSDEEFVESSSGSVQFSQAELWVFTIQKLRGIAKSRGLRGYSRLKKNELVEMLFRTQE